MRRAARKDGTKDAIVAALRASGAFVYDLKMPVDLLVSKGRHSMILMECKSLVNKKHPKHAKHTDAQIDFMAHWPGPPVVTVATVEEALAALALL